MIKYLEIKYVAFKGEEPFGLLTKAGAKAFVPQVYPWSVFYERLVHTSQDLLVLDKIVKRILIDVAERYGLKSPLGFATRVAVDKKKRFKVGKYPKVWGQL